MRRGKSLSHSTYQYFTTKVHPNRISKSVLQEHVKESRYLLSRCNDITQICDIINETPMADTALYNTALHECFLRLYKEFTFYDVDYLLHKMSQDNIERDVVTYHEILKIYSRSGRFLKCMEFFNEMVDKDRIKPNVVTFNRLIKCCRYSNNIYNANEILRLMSNDFNVSPDLYTLSELMFMYTQLQTTDLLEDTLLNIQKELKCGDKTYSHREFRDIIDAMNENNIDMAHIENVFDIMLDTNITPDDELLSKMLFIAIHRKDSFRIISYFDILVELVSHNNIKTKPLSIAVRALELLIGKQNDFISAYCFIDNCITYGITITNTRILSQYWECIKSTYLDLHHGHFNEENITKLIENAKDLPAQLENIQIMSILSKYRVNPMASASGLHELYSVILMAFYRYNSDVVYDVMQYWFDAYYITKDLWNQYTIHHNGELQLISSHDVDVDFKQIITVLNVSQWTYIELKTLFVCFILERFGDIINESTKTLSIKLSEECSLEAFDALKHKLTQCYGEDIEIHLMDSTQKNIAQIDLGSWRKCIEHQLHPQDESDSDDDDIVDRDLYLQ